MQKFMKSRFSLVETIIVIAIICLLAALCHTAKGADAVPVKEFYRAGEFSLDAFGELKTPDLDQERSAVGFGVNYYLTKNLGFGASTSFEDMSGAPFDHVSIRGLFRAPINRYAFYAFGGATRQLEDGEWSLILGPGFEARFTPNFGAFTEIGMDKQLTGSREVTAQARVGLRLSF